MVLLVLDGLGWNALQEHAHRLPTISGMAGGAITTVVPSTTATALTSICTGLTPAQHGVLGYRMVVGGEVLNVLRWSSTDARPPDPFDVQRHTAFLGRDVPVVTKSEFRNSGFSNAHLRGARFIGWSTVSVLVEHCVRLVASGDRFVYAYYPGVDNIAHEFGLHNGFYERELGFADRLVGDLLTSLPPGTVLVVTADHGQMHLERDDWIDLDALAPLVDVMAGDGAVPLRVRAEGRREGARVGGRPNLSASTRGCVHARAGARRRLDRHRGDRQRAGPARRRRARVARRVGLHRSRAAGRSAAAVGPREPHRRRDVRPAGGGGGRMSGSVEVRACAPDEWAVYRDLRLRALAEDPTSFGSTHAPRAGVHRGHLAAARVGHGGRVGATAGRPGSSARGQFEPMATELVGMWVARRVPGSRRRRRARRMGDRPRARAGSARVGLWFAAGNEAARRLYERCGFVEVEDATPVEDRFARSDHRMVLPLRDHVPGRRRSTRSRSRSCASSTRRRAVEWYARLGFEKQWEHQFEAGFPWFVSVARGHVRLYLSEHKGDTRPDTLLHLNVVDIDAVAAEFGETVDEDGLAGRQVNLVDPDGNRLRIATPRS